MINPDAPLFVHADAARGMIAARRAGVKIQPRSLQESLIGFLADQVRDGTDSLVFPAFNYDYGSTRIFDMDKDPVQVGSLAEWVRRNGQMYRTAVPFFSFLCGRDPALDTTGRINPFGGASGFQWLVDQDATILMFGAPLHSLTFIHYAEEASGNLLYRYQKAFPGRVLCNGETRDVEFSMHVRPMGVHLDYDWPGIEADLTAEGILMQADYSADMKWLNARRLREYWSRRMARDPFCLIDAQSRAHFETATDGGRRAVRQEDYEDV